MCGGGKKVETPALPPTPAPAPIPTPSNVAPQVTEQQRAQRITNLRKGILSTIKTTPSGIIGAGADLVGPGAKKTLGS